MGVTTNHTPPVAPPLLACTTSLCQNDGLTGATVSLIYDNKAKHFHLVIAFSKVFCLSYTNQAKFNNRYLVLQARKEMLKTRKSVVKIQRIYRARVQKRLSTEQLNKPPEKDHLKTGRTPSPNASQGAEIGEETKESFELYQDDITELKWKSQQLIETATMGEDYEPQKILLISSNIQRPEWLARVTLQDVHVIMYQFSQVTLKDILDNISLSLDDYRVGSKAKRIAFVCQGGPGFVYICRGKVLTSKKLGKDRELRDFVRQLGNFISKKDPSNAKVHFIGSNVLGNKQGVTLLEDVQKYMHPARVTVESPFEISECGFEMLNEYFNIDLYNIWKKSRFTRMKIVGV